MNTVLFPTDFSENATHAFQFAKMIAKTKGSEIKLLYSYSLPLTAPINAFTSREQTLNSIEQDIRNAALEYMKIYTDELAAEENHYEVLLEEGNATNVIAAYCEIMPIDLVVMGTKGQTNNRDFLIGSTTSRVMEKINTPLLAVPMASAIKPFEKIVFATNLKYSTTDEAIKAIQFSRLNKSSLTFLHVKTHTKNEENELSELKGVIHQNSDIDLHLKIIPADTITHGLDRFLKEHKSDLLILCNHTKSLFERLFHRSISKQMILHSNIPLLIFSKKIRPMVFF